MDATITKDDVLAVLQEHIGRERGVSAAFLASRLGIRERDVRKHVSALREEGAAIAAHPSLGYFVAVDADDLELCCQFLRSRAMHSLHLEAQMRKISLPDLLGQIHLKT